MAECTLLAALDGKFTGFTSTLPSGATEIGARAVATPKTSLGYGPISFNIPLASAPAVSLLGEGAAPTGEVPGERGQPPGRLRQPLHRHGEGNGCRTPRRLQSET